MYEKAKTRWFKHFDFMLFDFVMIELAFLLATYIRTHGYAGAVTPSMKLYVTMRSIIVILDLIIVSVVPVHQNILKRKPWQELVETLKNVLLIEILMILYLYFTQQSYYFSRMIFLLFAFLATCFMFICRCIHKTILRRQLAKKGKLIQTVLVTESRRLSQTAKKLMKHCENRFTLVSVALVDYNPKDEAKYEGILHNAGVPEACKVVGNINELCDALGSSVIADDVIVDFDDRKMSEKLTANLLEQGLTVHINLLRIGAELPNQDVTKVGGLTVLTTSQNVASPVMLFVKRLMDIAGALVGLFIAFIIMIIFGPIIYKQSPGNIFFSQERIGAHGRRFRIWKFRSMQPDAEAMKDKLKLANEMDGDKIFKITNDPRIIPIGAFMRKYSLDEFPQFYNILKGDMSLVGTRPPTVDEWNRYEQRHRARMSFKPGLTGMWQVNGRSDIKNFEEIVNLDMKYIREWTIWLDIKILLKTVYVVITKQGSA